MRPWQPDSVADRALYNPAFLGIVVAEFVDSHQAASGPPSLDLALVAASMAATGSVRRSLPKSTNAKFSNWTVNNRSVAVTVGSRAQAMDEAARRGALFALAHDWLGVEQGRLTRGITTRPRAAGSEVAEILKSARFLGRWLARSGSDGTVLAVLGVRP